MIIPNGYSHQVNIGSGSFSSVYRVYQKKLERHVALKIIPLKHKNHATIIEKEMRTLGSMRLTCVPHIYDIRRSSSRIIIVMEWIYGIPLSHLIEQPLSISSKISLAGDIIHALAKIHSAGIVHRDIKPENIIATPERGIVFVDFGFSISENSNVNKSQNILQGTPAYMAPELWLDNNDTDYHKTDLYALGVLLREMLGTALPDSAKTLFNVNPSLRPADCISFEQDWLKLSLPLNTECVRDEVSRAAADFTAKLLFEGAHKLFEKNRKEEAYALLTESLDIWSDNPDALDFLQNHFSLPISTSKKLIFTWIAAICILVSAIAGAFLIGVHTSSSRIVSDSMFFTYDQDERQGTFLSLHSNNRDKPQIPAPLRDITTNGDLSGSLTVLLPNVKGTLFIDDQILSLNNQLRFSGSLLAGTHRIDWYDSIQKRRYGETIDLKPFSMKTISLQRFTYEQQRN